MTSTSARRARRYASAAASVELECYTDRPGIWAWQWLNFLDLLIHISQIITFLSGINFQTLDLKKNFATAVVDHECCQPSSDNAISHSLRMSTFVYSAERDGHMTAHQKYVEIGRIGRCLGWLTCLPKPTRIVVSCDPEFYWGRSVWYVENVEYCTRWQ